MSFFKPFILTIFTAAVTALAQTPAATPLSPSGDLPKSWIDADTGHRVIRLSTEAGSASLYFHYNSYSADGKKMVFDSPSGISEVDLQTFKVDVVVPNASTLETSRTSNEVYYLAQNAVMAADLDTHAVRKVVDVPPVPAGTMLAGGRGGGGGFNPTTNPAGGPAAGGQGAGLQGAAGQGTGTPGAGAPGAAPAGGGRRGRGGNGGGQGRGGLHIQCVNCDGTLFAGTINAIDPSGKTVRPATRPAINQLEHMFPGKTLAELTPAQALAVQKENGLSRQLSNPGPIAIFTINAKTGAVRIFDYDYAWTDHLQFSPTDPNLLMYAHEGSWHEVERIWNVRVDGDEPAKLMHVRTMPMEIAGHEFWSHDGNIAFYDLQTPRSQVFWIGGVNIHTGEQIKYHLEQNWWGIHFAVSHDGKMFADDGGDPGQVAFAPDGEWVNLFRVQPDGSLSREKLLKMGPHEITDAAGRKFTIAHNYKWEPNVTFSPDDKYVIFRSNMFGVNHVFAVEVAKAQ